MDEDTKEAAYYVLKDIAGFLFEENKIGPNTYNAITDRENFYNAVNSKYKLLQVIKD